MTTDVAAKQAQEAADREITPSTIVPDDDNCSECSEAESHSSCFSCDSALEEAEQPRQLQAGLFDEDLAGRPAYSPPSHAQVAPAPVAPPAAPQAKPGAVPEAVKFETEETFFIFDWDDTILPSSWVQRQGLRLDAASAVTAEQREALAEVAERAGQTLRAARQHGTVVLVTNAERGWIELSCHKFLPTLAPMLENVRMVSARTTYEHEQCRSPLDWKVRAFDVEIARFFGEDAIVDPTKRKNVFSIGDSVHEREALLKATASVPNCLPKSLKFVDRPDISQICKQHELIFVCFGQLVQHGGNLDMCIRCP